MSSQVREKQKIQAWIDHLNTHSKDWVHGDTKHSDKKTADIVNKQRKLCIEVKGVDDVDLQNKEGNTEIFSNRLQGAFHDANKKFSNYPAYKSLLLVETSAFVSTLQVVLTGIQQLHYLDGKKVGQSIRNERIFKNIENIGCVIFWPVSGNLDMRTIYFFENRAASQGVSLSLQDAESILGCKLERLEYLS